MAEHIASEPGVAGSAPTSTPAHAGFIRNNLRDYGMLISLVAIMALFQVLTDGTLLRPLNLTNLVLQNSYIVIMALGMLLVIVAGHIDLSVGSVCGFIGALASIRAENFYAQLVKPAWAPPPGVFSPVWTTLYLMMAIAAWLAWKQRAPGGATRFALWLFAIQLALNALWSWLFFRWHLGGLAVFEVCVLWFAILAMVTQFWRLRPLAVTTATRSPTMPCARSARPRAMNGSNDRW